MIEQSKLFDLNLETVHEKVRTDQAANTSTIDVKDLSIDTKYTKLSSNKNSITKKVV